MHSTLYVNTKQTKVQSEFLLMHVTLSLFVSFSVKFISYLRQLYIHLWRSKSDQHADPHWNYSNTNTIPRIMQYDGNVLWNIFVCVFKQVHAGYSLNPDLEVIISLNFVVVFHLLEWAYLKWNLRLKNSYLVWPRPMRTQLGLQNVPHLWLIVKGCQDREKGNGNRELRTRVSGITGLYWKIYNIPY